MLFIGVTVLCNCSPNLKFTEIQHWRRNQDITNIDPGNRVNENKIVLSGYMQFAGSKQKSRVFYDTLVDTGLIWTSVRQIKSTIHEKHNLAGIDIAYGINDYIAAGINSDISFGSIDYTSDRLRNSTVDFAFFMRFCSGSDKYTIGFKPELLLSTSNGDIFIDNKKIINIFII